MLSDSCFDFCDTTDGRPSKKDIAEAVASLKDDIEHYSAEPFDYAPVALKLLRFAVAQFEAGNFALAGLRAVADAQRAWFDRPPRVGQDLQAEFLPFILANASPVIDQTWLDTMLGSDA